MKRLLLLITFLAISSFSFSQEKIGKPFFTGLGNVTFAVNEHYTLDPDDGEPFLVPNAIFLRMGFGYEFKKRIAISVNGGFDYHWNYAVSAFPTYFSLKYNITEDQGDNFFTEVSYGKMWRPSSNYPDGNYYRVGFGTQVKGAKRWNTIIRLDFHRKGIIGFDNNRLDSVSLGLGFSFF
ncbi:hypothetical protein [uncultured Polaribacter sp.]|uniref:hypothetical protein n=1 Tax=uncultured Polaribacter sp. TaxID=174711 RepID=UPI002603B879|nr:hypothetical protein [uncultured Polaribacter sp.]